MRLLKMFLVTIAFLCLSQGMWGQYPGQLSPGQRMTYYNQEFSFYSTYSSYVRMVIEDGWTDFRGNSGVLVFKNNHINGPPWRCFELYDSNGATLSQGKDLPPDLVNPQILLGVDSSIWIAGWRNGNIHCSKFDFSANLILQRKISGYSGGQDLEMMGDTSGNVYILGEDHLFKLDPQGNMVWGRSFASNSPSSRLIMNPYHELYVHADNVLIRMDLDGNMKSAFTVPFSNFPTITLDRGIALGLGDFVHKYDSLGIKQWQTQLSLQGGAVVGLASDYKSGGIKVATLRATSIGGNGPWCPWFPTTYRSVLDLHADGGAITSSISISSVFERYDLQGFHNAPNGELLVYGGTVFHSFTLTPCIGPMEENGHFQKYAPLQVCQGGVNVPLVNSTSSGALPPVTLNPVILNLSSDPDTVSYPQQYIWLGAIAFCNKCPRPDITAAVVTNGLTAVAFDTVCNYRTVWRDHGDGQVDSSLNAVHQYAATGTYTTCLYATNDCGTDSICQTISVCNSLVQANFGYQPVIGSEIAFSDSSFNATHWRWDFGDGNTDTSVSPVHQYANCGVYPVTLVVYDGCGSDTLTQVVSLLPADSVHLGPDTSFCPGDTLPIAANAGFLSYAWSNGDTVATTWAAHSGLYWVEAMDSVGCLTRDTMVIDSIPLSSVSFGSSNAQLTVSFSNTSSNANEWLWDFGDGNQDTTQHPVHQYANCGTYTVTLITQNPCGFDTVSQVVSITPAQVHLPPDTLICDPDTLLIHAGSGYLQYAWSTGDTTASIQVTQPGTYVVDVLDSLGCWTSDSIIVTLGAAPSASFTASITQLTAAFTSFTLNTIEWLWDFGDGHQDTVPHPSHSYLQAGDYWVCLTATSQDGCPEVFCDSVSVHNLVGLPEMRPGSISVYPNPTTGEFYLEFAALPSEMITLSVFNALGQLVHEQVVLPDGPHLVEVRAPLMAEGLYLLRLGEVRVGSVWLRK